MKLVRKNSIEAGDLKYLCKLLQPISIPDGRGGSGVAFTEYAEVWCKAMPSNNNRVLEQAQITFNESVKFTIRVSEVPIKPNWKIEFNGKTYQIHTIYDIDTRYQYLSILAYTNNL